MLKGKQFGIIAEYSTSTGQKKSIITFDCDAIKPVDVWSHGLKFAFEHEGDTDVLVGIDIIPSDAFVDLMLHIESEVKNV